MRKQKFSLGLIPVVLITLGAFVLGVFMSDKAKPMMAKIPVLGGMLNPENNDNA